MNKAYQPEQVIVSSILSDIIIVIGIVVIEGRIP